MTVAATADAFGLACREYHREGAARTPTLIEFEGGGSFNQNIAHYFLSREGWPEEESELVAKARGRVLDVGTGAGQYAIELQQATEVAGVTGVDYSPACVEVARARGLTDTRLLDVMDGDLPGGPYDTFLLMGHNVALLDPKSGGRDLLARLGRAAAPDSQILGTVGDLEVLPEEMRRRFEDNSDIPGLCSFRLRIVHGEVVSDWFDYCFASPLGIHSMCESTPWAVQQVTKYINGFCVVMKLR